MYRALDCKALINEAIDFYGGFEMLQSTLKVAWGIIYKAKQQTQQCVQDCKITFLFSERCFDWH